jgi:hypothetical protein
VIQSEYGYGLMSAPDDDEHAQFCWLHIRPGDQVMIVLGNKLPMWYRAHWHDGRMQPCQGDDCWMCSAGIGRQRRWVFSVVLWSQKKPYLWEVSESLAMDIRAICEHVGTEVDVKIRVSREPGSTKARLKVESYGIDEFHNGSSVVFPEPQEALQLTWAVISRRSESRSVGDSRSELDVGRSRREKSEY